MTTGDTSANWKNVNNWHWIEKDCTSWAHSRIKSILEDVAISEVSVSKVNTVEGEVSVNVRKGRIRQIYDLTMQLTLHVGDEDKDASITDYMSDTDYPGFEFNCSGLCSSIREELKKKLWDALLSFRREIEEEHGKSILITAETNSSEPGVIDQSNVRNFSNAIKDHEKPRDVSGVTFIKETITIDAPFREVWLCLTDPERIAAWTRGTSRVTSIEPGASFSLLNGNILGTITAMNHGKLKMDWRLKHWNSSCVSMVEFSGREVDGKTVIDLRQEGIPTTEAESVKENWHRYYWEPIKTLLGCSSTVF